MSLAGRACGVPQGWSATSRWPEKGRGWWEGAARRDEERLGGQARAGGGGAGSRLLSPWVEMHHPPAPLSPSPPPSILSLVTSRLPLFPPGPAGEQVSAQSPPAGGATRAGPRSERAVWLLILREGLWLVASMGPLVQARGSRAPAPRELPRRLGGKGRRFLQGPRQQPGRGPQTRAWPWAMSQARFLQTSANRKTCFALTGDGRVQSSGGNSG